MFSHVVCWLSFLLFYNSFFYRKLTHGQGCLSSRSIHGGDFLGIFPKCKLDENMILIRKQCGNGCVILVRTNVGIEEKLIHGKY